jgi:hypothetical protein
MWEAFWLWAPQHGLKENNDVMACAIAVKKALYEKSKSQSIAKFSQLYEKSDSIQQMFLAFKEECESKSEMCQYWGVFQQMVLTIKHVVSSDREGNFALHIASVDNSLPMFRESDSLNYLRYGSFYRESMQLLHVNHPDVFRRFVSGQFVVKDHAGSFNAVAPDMKLEQSIQRASKSKGGIVGNTRKTTVVIEWQLIFHEILLISNILRQMTKDKSMDHSESADIHHDMIGRKADLLNNNVARLLDFVCSRGNPFVVPVPGIKLHNFVTKQLADVEVSVRLRQALQNGDSCYKEFRKERFLEKTKKLSATISKRSLPTMDYKVPTESTVSATPVSPKSLAAAQRSIDILKQRGMSLELIYLHDILPSSIIFEGDLADRKSVV